MDVGTIDQASIELYAQPLLASSSYAFLKQNTLFIDSHESIEDIVFDEDQHDPKAYKAFSYHFQVLRNALIKSLWNNGLYLGFSLAENLIFNALKHGTGAIEKDIASIIINNKMHAPCVIMYPLHSFGIADAAMVNIFSGKTLRIAMKNNGIVIYPQSNDRDGINGRIASAMKVMSINSKIDNGLIDHHVESRSLEWCYKNPVLFVRANVFQWDHFSNHFAIKLKLIMTKAYIAFLNMHAKIGAKRLDGFSTANTNNWETLDIKHYIIFQPDASSPGMYKSICVPMNAEPNEMAELSELSVDLLPIEWGKRSRYASNLKILFDKTESNIMQHHYFESHNLNQKTINSKLYNSMRFFLKSLRRADHEHDAIIMTAIAFETLLLDNYAPGIGKKLGKRCRLALKGVRGFTKYYKLLPQLYDARCEIAHSGQTGVLVDLYKCQQAFARCWIKIASNANLLPTASISNPIGLLLGD